MQTYSIVQNQFQSAIRNSEIGKEDIWQEKCMMEVNGRGLLHQLAFHITWSKISLVMVHFYLFTSIIFLCLSVTNIIQFAATALLGWFAEHFKCMASGIILIMNMKIVCIIDYWKFYISYFQSFHIFSHQTEKTFWNHPIIMELEKNICK